MNNRSDRKNVKTFNICVDDFFTNPDIIREYSSTLDYYPNPTGRWSGVRTKALSDIDSKLNQLIVSKIMRAHYPGHKNQISWEMSRVCFHKNATWVGETSNTGWVHVDDDVDVAGLIYLTPDSNLESGTNIFHLKDEWKDKHDDSEPCVGKRLLYSDSPDFDTKEYNKELKEWNDRFKLVSKFNNLYNRMVMWSGNEYHGAHSFEGYNDRERLTLLFFIGGIKVDNILPIDYVREIDKDINYIINSMTA